jgi:hypothetical protein
MRSHVKLLTLPNPLLICALLIAVSGRGARLCAQTTESPAAKDSARAQLAKIVHLNLGETTIDKLMATLSEQTGLTIKAAEYLSERSLTVEMDNLTAIEALDALDELNDWTWYPTLPGKILVTRRRLRMDAVPEAVPRMMQAAIPKEIRTYLQIPTPGEDLAEHVNIFDNSLHDGMKFANDRLERTVAADQSDLLTSLSPGILSGDPVHYAMLSGRQRTELLTALVFPLLRRTDYQLLHGDLPPHVSDVNSSVLWLTGGNTLLIGSQFINGKQTLRIGFGTPIR